MNTLARSQDVDALVWRVRLLRPDGTRRWGRMTVHQMVCHLTDAFRMATGEMPVRCRAPIHQRTMMKWIALYLPLRWPAGIMTAQEIDQELGGTKPTDFAADLAELEKRLTSFPVHCSTLECQPHPYFGRMSAAAWLRWGYLHVDHHLRQFGV